MPDKPEPRQLFWDSCILCRYLTETPKDRLSDIVQFIDEAKAGEVVIYFSTILLAEVRPSHLKQKGYGHFNELQADLQGALRPIAPNTNIMLMASSLRDHMFKLEKMQKDQKERVMTVPDAIHLATCVYVRDALEIPSIAFHTFDDGKSKGADGKAVPLLSFSAWSEHLAKDPVVAGVRKLPISEPLHPEPMMDVGAAVKKK